MPMINIEDSYILDETGAQVDKVTGLFTKDEGTTSGEKAFAQLNIGTAGSNRNLLDNPWFTVRQRGDGPFSVANTEAVDRWRTTSNSTMTGTTDGITVTTTLRTWGIQQRVAKDFLLTGKTYTISAMEQDGTITSATFTWTGSGMTKYVTGANVGFEISASNANYNQIYFTTNYVGSVYLRAVKLELGSVSTLANDTPPDYCEELAKCKFYCRVQEFTTDVSVGIGWAFSNSGAVIPNIFGFGNEMRAVPTVTSTGSFVLRTTGGSNINVTSFAIGASVKDAISLNASVASGLTANQPVRLQAGTGAKLVFSAEL